MTAYRVTVKNRPEMTAIYAATSRAKAKHRSWSTAKEIGYKVTFSDLTVRRAPEYDCIVHCLGKGCGEWFAEKLKEGKDS